MTQQPSSSSRNDIREPGASPGLSAPGPADPVKLESQSVAGEEDPGASMDMAGAPSKQPSTDRVFAPSGGMNPGDEAPEGTPGTGEDLCRQCGGSGRVGNAQCPSCAGTGKIIVGIGGA